MPIAVSTTATDLMLRIKFYDFRGQRYTEELIVDPATTDLNIAAFLTDLAGLTNARFTADKIAVYGATGTPNLAIAAPEQNISEQMDLTFDRTNPLNALKKISKIFSIPALVSILTGNPPTPTVNSVELLDGSYNPANTNLTALISFLQAQLGVKNVDDTVNFGGWTLSQKKTHHVTAEDLVDTV